MFVRLTFRCASWLSSGKRAVLTQQSDITLSYNKIAPVERLGTPYPKCGLWASSTCVIWELVRNGILSRPQTLLHQNLHFNEIPEPQFCGGTGAIQSTCSGRFAVASGWQASL
ncbi:uncharacterized protein LOC134809241 isoform X1 [Pan troglodytes]|uniref:uncharacterized protein LOC134809241 isoform X1 n=1 Tax=Pan troglodytes TaxID=9598 RepID=UPI00301411BC